MVRGRGYALSLQPDRVAIDLPGPERAERIEMSFLGGNPAPRMEPLEPLPGKIHYLVGASRSQWRTHIARYARVRYQDVYPGIDLVLYGNQRQLEYDFVVQPGADPAQIRLGFHGEQGLRVGEDGALVIATAGGELRQLRPKVYQVVDGERRLLEGRYRVTAEGIVAFDIPSHDRRLALTIDPVLVYSTYYGGDGADNIGDVAVDSAGSAYITGVAFTSISPRRGFVTKFNPEGSALEYSTVLAEHGGGGGRIAVDSQGAVYGVGGVYPEWAIPLVNAFQEEHGGSLDAWVYKLTADGSDFLYSSYLGGSGEEFAYAIAVDDLGQAHLVGNTASPNFPTVSAYQGSLRGPIDGFLTRVNAGGGSLGYSTYLGGNGDEILQGVGVDPAGNAYVAGFTRSSDYPVLNPVQATFGGDTDAVIAKFSPAGQLLYSTYLGGTASDHAASLAVDALGRAYVIGDTWSANFPLANAIQSTRRGGNNVFIAKLGSAGTPLLYSTYFGGTSTENGYDIAVDGFDNIYLTGHTASMDFPLVDPIQPERAGASEFFVAKLDSAGAVVHSTYLGGSAHDDSRAIAVDESGNAYVVGSTMSPNFPLMNPYDPVFEGGPPGNNHDGFLMKIGDGAAAPAGRLQFSAAAYSVNEGQGTLTLTVRRVGGSAGDVTVEVNTTAGTAQAGQDFEPITATLAFSSGETTGTLTLRIRNDTFFETAETLTVTLSQPSGGAVLGSPFATTVTIADDDTDGDQLVQTFTVRDANNPTGPGWQATESIPWLSLDAYTGVGPSTVTATVNPAGLPAGTHTGTITVTAEAEGSPQIVQVQYTVSDPPPVTLTPVADAYVRDGSSAGTNFGTQTTLQMRTTTTSGSNRDSYLKFDLGTRTAVSSAKLRVFASLSASGSVATAVHALANTTWTETGINWNNKPPRGASLRSVNVNSTSSVWYELDVTAYVQAELAAGRKILSFAFHDPANSTQQINLPSRQASSNRPQLVVVP